MTVRCLRPPRPETAGDPLAFEVISRVWTPVPLEANLGTAWRVVSTLHFDRYRGPDGACTFEYITVYTEALLDSSNIPIIRLLEIEDRDRILRTARGVVQ